MGLEFSYGGLFRTRPHFLKEDTQRDKINVYLKLILELALGISANKNN